MTPRNTVLINKLVDAVDRIASSMAKSSGKSLKVLILSQVYFPDVVSVAQHLTDFAVALAGEGHEVKVVTSQRGYDNPTSRFSKRQIDRGVEIVRVPCTGFGKTAKWRRSADFASFLLLCSGKLITERRPDIVIALTSPPLISFLGALFARFKESIFYYWVMDLNPDEAVAAGWIKKGSLLERALQKMSRYSLRRANQIIVMDHFMQALVISKGVSPGKVAVIAPWSHDESVRFDPFGRERFRQTHGLSEKVVIMYSGNHSPCHPLDTMMLAAKQLAGQPEFVFCFIGGGSEFSRVKRFAAENALENVLCLPYQPLDALSASLSAADLHIVVMGDQFVGTIHPCKIYNILTIGIPFAYIGPNPSHISEIVKELSDDTLCAHVMHGDVARLISHIRSLATASGNGNRKRYEDIAARFSQRILLPKMLSHLTQLAEAGRTQLTQR
jgi:colanic acid biosynthesis glycosyl transferase WcaI